MVTIQNNKAGLPVTAYTKKPKFGYIQLRSSTMTAENGWLREDKRSTLLRAEVEKLAAFVKHMVVNGEAPGIIRVIEVTESELLASPELMARLDKNKASFEEQIQGFIKMSGSKSDNAIPLLVDAERIIRFTDYIMQPQEHHVDKLVQHTNTAEVKAWRATLKTADPAAAQLPGAARSEAGK